MADKTKSNEELLNEIAILKNEISNYKLRIKELEQNNNSNSSFTFVNDSEMFRKVYNNVISNLPVPAYLIDSNGTFISCNMPFQYFLAKEANEIIGVTPDKIFPPEIAERTIYYNKAEQKQVEFTSFDIVNIKIKEEIRTIIVSETVYKNLNNEPLGILGVFNDITEKTKAEDKLRESEQKTRELNDIKDKFFHIVSHDLKSPFSALLGFSQLLVEDYNELDDDDKRDFIERMHATATFSYKMLTNLQMWSKLSLDKMPIDKEVINPIDVLQPVVEKFESEIREKNIKLQINSYGIDSIYIDKSMLQIIYENLISNAVKFSNENSTIEINFKIEEENVIIEIVDNGVGLSLEDQAKLFKIEIHTVKIGQKKTKGTGLGLVLCKLMAEENNGSIVIMSKEGKGTKVKLQFPKHFRQ